jgi:hypothetical protein
MYLRNAYTPHRKKIVNAIRKTANSRLPKKPLRASLNLVDLAGELSGGNGAGGLDTWTFFLPAKEDHVMMIKRLNVFAPPGGLRSRSTRQVRGW